MKQPCYTHIFEGIAASRGISVADIRLEIEQAIRMGMNDADPVVRAQWADIPKCGATPTPDELLAYVVNSLKKDNAEALLRRYLLW